MFIAQEVPGGVHKVDPILRTGFSSDFSGELRKKSNFNLSNKLL